MSLREVLEVMPYRLRSRFESLGSYVQGCIDQVIDDLRRNSAVHARRIVVSTDDRQMVQMIVFVVALARFFKDGTRAASLATDACESLDTIGFIIGSTIFEGRNDNVMMGQRLRDQLLAALEEEEINQWANATEPLGEIVKQLVTRVVNE